MRMKIVAACMLLNIIALSCKKDKDHRPPSHIYVAGHLLKNQIMVPVIWKDSVRIELSRPDISKDADVLALDVDKNNVYAVGYWMGSSFNSKPCVWKNNVRADLSMFDTSRYGYANSVVVAGTDVFIAGNISNAENVPTPCYWKNGIRIDLPSGNSLVAEAYDIKVSNNNVYVGGVMVDSFSRNHPCIWKNGVLTLLPGFGQVRSLFISGSSVYAAGYAGNIFEESPGPCYWKNNVRVELSRKKDFSWATSIVVANNNVYVSGHVKSLDGFSEPCYWKNGQRTELSLMDNKRGGVEGNIAITGADTWIAGSVSNSSRQIFPCLWRNGQRQAIPITGAQEGKANWIVVK